MVGNNGAEWTGLVAAIAMLKTGSALPGCMVASSLAHRGIGPFAHAALVRCAAGAGSQEGVTMSDGEAESVWERLVEGLQQQGRGGGGGGGGGPQKSAGR